MSKITELKLISGDKVVTLPTPSKVVFDGSTIKNTDENDVKSYGINDTPAIVTVELSGTLFKKVG